MTVTSTTAQRGGPALEPGSPLVEVLYEVYDGRPVTLVDSPPGAGKSTLVTQVVSYLFRRTEWDITVVVSTNAQGTGLSARLAQEIEDLANEDGKVPLLVSGDRMVTPQDAYSVAPPQMRTIEVRTLASCKQSPPVCQLMIFDEFYQMTFADCADAADQAQMILGVGDPGQIGPVVSFDTFAWETLRVAPHMRSPEAMRQRKDTHVIELEATYRLGPITTHCIAPLYSFPFESRRIDRHLEQFPGEIEALEVPVRHNAYDLDTMRTVMERAQAYVGSTLVVDGEHDPEVTRITESDVCIIVSRNAQVSALEALALEYGFTLGELTIGTADRLQGGQWHCVVAVDPTLSGAESDHALASGRLCVMASRHMTHMTWVYDDGWREVMRTTPHRADARMGSAVRERILAAGS